MNKLFTKIATAFVGMAMAIGVGVAIGSKVNNVEPVYADTTYTMSIDQNNSGNNNVHWTSGNPASLTYNSKTWSASYTGGAGPTSGNKDYCQIGTKKSPATNVTLTTTGFGGYKIVSASLTCYCMSAAGPKLTITAGTTKMLDSANLVQTTSTKMSSTTNNVTLGSGQSLTFSIDSNAGAGIVLVSVEVVYTNATTYTVTYDGNGKTGGSVPTDSTAYVSGATVTVKGNTGSLAKTGYSFGGWNTQPDGNGTNYAAGSGTFTISANTTLYAKWTPNQYNINYYDQGGSAFSGSHESGYPTAHTYGTSTTLKSATKAGYDFNGWFTTSACTGSAVTSLGATDYTSAINLYAKWTASGNTYSITTTVTNGTYSGDTSITDNGGVASVTIAPTGDYKLPTSVSVSGANHTYNSSTGVISLSNATGNVTISAAMVALTEYSITVNETNGSHTGASTIKESRTATLTFTADSGFGNPASVTVSGATQNWVRGTGVLTLSNPTGNVTVTYTAVGNELDSITLSANSGNYTLGDAFVKPTVTAHYTLAADANVTNSPNLEVLGYNPYTTGSQAVTIKYTEGGIEKTASYTANVSAASVETITTWEAATLSQLTADDVFVIVGNNGSNYAMTNDNGTNSAPGVTAVTVSNNKLSAGPAANLQWNISGNATDGYTFYPNGSTETWLYCTSTNNGVRVGTNANKTFTISDEGYLLHAGTSRYVGIYNSTDWRCYTSINSNIQNQTFSYFKKVETQVGTGSLIRIVCDPTIDPETGYKGGDKYVGDIVHTNDFVVKKQLDSGNELTAITNFTINGGSEVELTSTSNTITVSYTEGGITKTAEVVVSATERSATVTSVTLVQGAGVVKNYIDWSGTAWDYTDLTVHCVWSDSTFNEDLSLAALVQSGDATVSPAKPSVGVTSFTVSYTYHETAMTSNTVDGITVVADYVTGISWTGTTGEQFKAYSGGQLTAAQVGAWSVVPTFAGAGTGSALSFGSYTLKVGSKVINSLPYTWQSEDDGQELSITYGKKADGSDFVKKNGTAVANICASINAIDHTETITPAYDEQFTGYKKVTSTSEITSGGKYLIVCADSEVALDSGLGTSMDGNENYQTVSFREDGLITLPSPDNFYFTITISGGNYVITTASGGVHIGATSDSNSLNTSTSVEYTNTISFEEDGSANIIGSGGAYLRYNSAANAQRFRYYKSSTYTAQSAIQLYKYYSGTIHHDAVTETTEYANKADHFNAQKKVVEFAKFMNTTMNGTNVCSGTFENLSTAWASVSAKYTELFGAGTTLNETELAWAKNMLKYATASWGSEAEAACVEKAMRTYEFVVQNHKLTAFMSDVRPVQANRIGLLSTSLSDTNNISIIVIVSLVSVAAVGGYFFLRKRKEN